MSKSISCFTGGMQNSVPWPNSLLTYACTNEVTTNSLLANYYFLFACTVKDFNSKDKASGIKFCTVDHQHPGQTISHLGELCSPRSSSEAQNRTNGPAHTHKECSRTLHFGWSYDSAFHLHRTATTTIAFGVSNKLITKTYISRTDIYPHMPTYVYTLHTWPACSMTIHRTLLWLQSA